VPLLLLEGPNYTYPSDINELRGAARGFIRSDEEGVLTEFHHRSSVAPFAVILVDEVEKSHAQLQRFFLSVMDRGTVTDNRGQTLRFSNTLLVFTSNLGYSGAQQQGEPIGYGGARSGRRYPRREIEREMKRTLSPEFLNRLITVHFAPLSRVSIARIFDLEMEKIAAQYRRVHDLALEVTESAKEALIGLGYSDDYGARFLATTLQRHCNIEVSKKIRRDEEPGGRDVGPVLDYLREARAGRRVWREAEAEALVQRQARARLPYRRLRIDHRDGAFVYESGKAAPHR
jgi:ATP-dependent Clp protease ATP-binding subunit ClpC